MEEVINEILEFVKQKTGDFSYLDQAQIFEDLAGRMSALNADAMRAEYLGTDDYLLDGV